MLFWQGRLRWAKCQPAWRFWSYRVKDGANIQDNCVMHGFPEQELSWKKMDILVIALSFMVALSPQCISGNERGSDGRRGDWRNSIVGASAFVKAKAEMPANY